MTFGRSAFCLRSVLIIKVCLRTGIKKLRNPMCSKCCMGYSITLLTVEVEIHVCHSDLQIQSDFGGSNFSYFCYTNSK